MRQLAKTLAILVVALGFLAWALAAEAWFDLHPDRDGLESFNGWFGVRLSQRPVLVRYKGFCDGMTMYRLNITPEELDEIVRSAGLDEDRAEPRCLDGRRTREVWWRPASPDRLRCFGLSDPPRVSLEMAYEPATGLLHARAVTY